MCKRIDNLQTLQRPRGISLVEVVIAAAVVAIAVTAISSSMMNSMLSTQQNGEYLAAQLAARKKMEEIYTVPFSMLVDTYKSTALGGSMGNTFEVSMTDSGSSQATKLMGFTDTNGVPQPAGEVIIITNESARASDYGRDLFPADGRPDGCTFVGLPMDLNGNGNTTDGDTWAANGSNRTAIRLPIGVVIRWPGVRGEERYELWTIRCRD